MDDFYDENLLKVHSDVKSFFKRNFHIDPNYKNGEYLDICVSIDGSYGHMGRNSKWGVSFVCESITGRLLDFDFSDNGKCEYGKFHGSPGAMETHQALVLFKRSTLWVFRYTEYVSDGDAKGLEYLNEGNI